VGRSLRDARSRQPAAAPVLPPAQRRRWEPPVDVYETAHDLWIVVALPGVGADQIEIAVGDGAVVVAGERRLPVEARAIIHRLEIPAWRFERRIPLPAGRYRSRAASSPMAASSSGCRN